MTIPNPPPPSPPKQAAARALLLAALFFPWTASPTPAQEVEPQRAQARESADERAHAQETAVGEAAPEEAAPVEAEPVEAAPGEAAPVEAEPVEAEPAVAEAGVADSVSVAQSGSTDNAAEEAPPDDGESPGVDPTEVEPDPERAAELHDQGLRAWAEGDASAAVDLLEHAAAAAPNDLLVGTDYRQAVIAFAEKTGRRGKAAKAPYERAQAFFDQLVKAHPGAANAYLNYAFALVDRLPTEGAITQVILANDSLGQFGKALELEESWLGYYSRGHAYLFWPPIFGRAEMGITDLERAVKIAEEAGEAKPYHARAWAALGDGFWRLESVEQARDVWKQGLALYPEDPELLARWQRENRDELDAYLNTHYDTSARVATHLREIYGDRLEGLAREIGSGNDGEVER